MTEKTEVNTQYEECEEEEIDLSALMPIMMGGQQRDSLSENGVIFLNGPVTQKSTENILKRMWAYHFDEEYTDPLNLIINSPGGYTDAGWAVIDTMAAIKNPVRTIAMGTVASMGFMIFIAGAHRAMSENVISMIHHFSTATWGSYPELLASRKGHELEYYRGMRHLIQHSKYTTETQVKEYLLKDQDTWLSPKQMKACGLVDTIFKLPRRPKEKKK
jgi:ATP-dependent Clp protease protease subunit